MLVPTLIAAVVIGIFAFFFRLMPVQAATSPERVREWLRSVCQAIGLNLYFGWLKMKFRFASIFEHKKARALKFRAWADRELSNNPDLHAWILELPDSALHALTDGAQQYCANLNIELSWLFGRDLDVAPDVRETVKLILAEYLAGCFREVNHKEAINLYSVYHKLTTPDQYKRWIDLRRAVFKQITALGLTQPVPAHDLIMSSELQRQELAAAALRDAASRDWNAFAQALSNVLAANEQLAT